ncbi:MAG: AlkA N-terminal domain-containing protein [Solirubrobacterales bacterium]
MIPPFEQCYAAAEAKDARFDGWFVGAVTSTGIYCRPSCPARTPKAANMRFYPTAAAAQQAGFRACKRCRPDAAPGSPEWDLRADLVGRAMRLIADGVIDREGVGGLAARLGYAERHVHRQMVAVVGAGPLAIARANRAQTARILIETTTLPMTDVASAAGFASVRQFNDTVREVFAATPRELRRKAGPQASELRTVTLRLRYRQPFDFGGMLGFLRLRAVEGVEHADETSYSRSLRLPHGSGIVTVTDCDAGYLNARFQLDDLRDLGPAVERARRLLDLDADPAAADTALATDKALKSVIAAAPGRRVPGCVSGDELAMRAVLGQQVSVAGAVTAATKLTTLAGDKLKRPVGEITKLFPAADSIAALDPAMFAMPRARANALVGLAETLAGGELALDGGADRSEVRERLVAQKGIGDWTADYVAMRALRDPDAFLPSDLGVKRGLERLGRDGSPRAALQTAEAWRPYRAYALQHLWSIPAESTENRNGKAKT